MVVKLLFCSQIFEQENSMDLHILRFPESKIFLMIRWCILSAKFLIKSQLESQILYFTFPDFLYTGAHKKIQKHDDLWTQILLSAFYSTPCRKKNTCTLKEMSYNHETSHVCSVWQDKKMIKTLDQKNVLLRSYRMKNIINQ